MSFKIIITIFLALFSLCLVSVAIEGKTSIIKKIAHYTMIVTFMLLLGILFIGGIVGVWLLK